MVFLLIRGNQRFRFWQWSVNILIPAAFCLSLYCSAIETYSHHDFGYYLLSSRFWELAAGALLCLAFDKGRLAGLSPRFAGILIIAGIILLGISDVVINETDFPFPLALLPVVGTLCCIVGIVAPEADYFGIKLLKNKMMIKTGIISYSIYLWHWPIIVFFRWTVGVENALMFAFIIVLTFLVSWFSYKYVETPFLQATKKFQQKVVWSLSGSVACICSAAFVFIVLGYSKIVHRFSLSTVNRNAAIWNAHEGFVSVPGIVNWGVAGKRWSEHTLFIFGDSHAGAYGGLANQLRNQDGLAFCIDYEGGRHLGSLVYPANVNERGMRTNYLQELKQYGKHGDVVLLAFLRVSRYCEGWGVLPVYPPSTFDDWLAESNRMVGLRQGEEFLDQIKKLGFKVIVDAPKPVFKAPPFRCSDWFNRANPVGAQGFVMGRDELLQHRASAMLSLDAVKRDLPEILIWDPFYVFCTNNTCNAFDDPGHPVFFDGDHLTAYGAGKLYPSFHKLLEALWD